MSSSSRPKVALPRPRSRRTYAMGMWAWILGISLAALVATYMMFVEPPPPRKIVIASGGPNGAYYRYARKYAEELQKEGLSVEVRETAGSVENLRLLGRQDSGVSIAIVQSGVAGPEDLQHFRAWAACTASRCGSSTAATGGSSASASSRASGSASARRAAGPTPSPCNCSPPMG